MFWKSKNWEKRIKHSRTQIKFDRKTDDRERVSETILQQQET